MSGLMENFGWREVCEFPVAAQTFWSSSFLPSLFLADNFDHTSGLCRSHEQSQHLARIKFVCFDSIDNFKPFEERFSDAQDLLGRPQSVDQILANPVSFQTKCSLHLKEHC